jgi:hypothetical protein
MPSHAIDIPSGAYFIWPFNLLIGGVRVRYSTAQLFTKIDDPDGMTLYFAETRGIPSEFAFDAATAKVIRTTSGVCRTESGVTYVTGIVPSMSSSIELRSRDGKPVRIVLLTSAEAEDAWKVRIAGRDHLLFTHQDFFADDKLDSTTFQIRSRGSSVFNFVISPPISMPFQAEPILKRTIKTPNQTGFTALAQPRYPKLQINLVQKAGVAAPVKTGPPSSWDKRRVAEAPGDERFQAAAKWSIVVPKNALTGLSNLFLDVDYQGDVAQLRSDHELLVDDFFNGARWQIGLKRYLKPNYSDAFEMQILPLRGDAPIFLEPTVRARVPKAGQIEALRSIRLIPEYQLSVTFKTQ